MGEHAVRVPRRLDSLESHQIVAVVPARPILEIGVGEVPVGAAGLYLPANGSPANLAEAVDGSGFTSAMTGTSIFCGVLPFLTTFIVGRALRSQPPSVTSDPDDRGH